VCQPVCETFRPRSSKVNWLDERLARFFVRLPIGEVTRSPVFEPDLAALEHVRAAGYRERHRRSDILLFRDWNARIGARSIVTRWTAPRLVSEFADVSPLSR
jgi:hypothetical protein